MLLSDAYYLNDVNPAPGRESSVEVADAALEYLRASGGYEAIRVEYGDKMECADRYMVGLSRVALAGHGTAQLGRRKALAMQLAGDGTSGLKILGVHFNDETENNRIVQAVGATEHFADEDQAVIVGDFNTMHGSDTRSRLIAHPLSGSLARHIPHSYGRSIAERVHQMGWGSTFRIIEERGFYDADPSHRPSFPSRLPVLHLDRCFVSDNTGSHGFQVEPHHPGSDHRSINVVIET